MEPNTIDNTRNFTIDKIIKRFIKHVEINIINDPDNNEKIVSLDKFKKSQSEKSEDEELMDNIALNVGDAMMSIIGSKVFIATGDDIGEPDSNVSFNDGFEVFKESVNHAEAVYQNENKNIYEMPMFTVIDVITSITAAKIIETYFNDASTDGQQ